VHLQQERQINNKCNVCTCNEIRRACAARLAEEGKQLVAGNAGAAAGGKVVGWLAVDGAGLSFKSYVAWMNGSAQQPEGVRCHRALAAKRL
jgi:hypothetical protein